MIVFITFAVMVKARIYTAYVLLLAFVAVIMPWQLLHDSLSNHTAEEHTYCASHHKGKAAHIEASYGQCSLFDGKTVLYNKADFYADFQLLFQLNAVYNTAIRASVSKAVAVNLPSRAPPVC